MPLPPTLTFVCLHGGMRMDPRTAGIPGPLLVLCRDGEREVVIAVGRDAASWLLGALRVPVPAVIAGR